MAADIVGILLAAGAGRRFGGPKLLAPGPEGQPVGLAAARSLAAAVDRCVAVVRPDDHRLAELLLAEGIDVLRNPRPERGMGASLAFAVAAMPAGKGWLVALGDMPWVQPSTAQRVAGALRAGALLAAPLRKGRRGHPVGFAVDLGHELRALRGDRGARAVLHRHRDRLARVAVDDDGCLLDVDRPGDLRPGGVASAGGPSAGR